MEQNRIPKGVRTAGQFAASLHGEPVVGLRGDLHIDKAAANNFPDQVESIQNEGLKGALTAHDGKLTFTSNDGRSFDIHQDGHLDEDGTPGWAIDNHDQADTDDPAYGLRKESRTDNLGEDLADLAFESAAIEAFTLNAGSDDYTFRQFGIVRHEDSAGTSASFVDSETNDDLDVYYDADAQKLMVYYADSEVTGTEADEVLKDLVDSVDIDCPDGSPSQKMAWHMERSLRMAAAKDDSPEWLHPYRTAGLTWEDRHDGR